MNTRTVAKVIWGAFLVWSTLGIFSIVLGVNLSAVSAWPLNNTLNFFVRSSLQWGDFIFLLLGFLNLLLFSAAHLGWRQTCLCCAGVLLLSAVAETVGTLTGFPFGNYYYTPVLGPRLGGVLPLAIPLAWWTVLSGFYFILHDLRPTWTPRLLALGTAFAAVGFDWILEPFAWQVRHYWIWAGLAVPLQNYLSWFVLSFALARLLPLHGRQAPGRRLIPALTLGLMLLLFVAGRLAWACPR